MERQQSRLPGAIVIPNISLYSKQNFKADTYDQPANASSIDLCVGRYQPGRNPGGAPPQALLKLA